MKTTIRLVEMPEETSLAPLGVLGYCLTRSNFYAPALGEVKLAMKKIDHTPAAKLLDVLASILSGCRSIEQVNTKLRPDLALACAWGREQFAEQSNLSRTLDAFDESSVAHLRRGSESLFRRESRVLRHDFDQQWLWLDIDLTPLPISKRAEGSSKGKIGGEKTRMVANWHGCRHPTTRKPCFPASILAINTAARPIFRCCVP